MLEVSGLNTFFGKSHILQGVSLRVEEGEIVSLLGRNGAGKSTTLKSIMGIARQRTGSIALDGADLMPRATHEITRLGIAYVPEDRRMFSELTVLENLEVAALGERHWTVERVHELFPVLRERSALRAKNLSGGEQQMLAIGRSLMNNPRVMLLDEPFEGLAPIVIGTLIESIRQIRDERVAVLLVEQNLQATLKLADRNYVLEQGVVVYEGTTEEFTRDETVQERYLSV